MATFRKIRLYIPNGRTLCVTMQSRTCREALARFKASPYWIGANGWESIPAAMVPDVRACFDR